MRRILLSLILLCGFSQMGFGSDNETGTETGGSSNSQMIFGDTPWSCRDINSYLANIQTKPLLFPHSKPISENSKDFLRKCLVIDEQERIGIKKKLFNEIIRLARHIYSSTVFSINKLN